ncbi:MAG: hypothetical protein JKY15_07435, partial [Deltaproteobacteria bacterium]|nr:hypothetical protein [Deltaproteobacteria bacterium]
MAVVVMKISGKSSRTMMAVISFLSFTVLIYAAERFSSISQPPGYVPPMTLSNTDLTNGAMGYRPWFENGAWQGDIIEYTITSSGGISTSIDVSGTTPTNSGSNWSARLQFASAEVDANYWNSGRKIITWSGTSQIAFRWNNLTQAQKEALDITNKLATSSPIFDFVRGDRSNEKPAGTLRTRYSLLGDIMHSNPVFVGAPADDISESSYTTFKNANTDRAPRVYVGANDGMLHVFDASNGNEVYAYVPSMLIGKLDDLAADPYFHRYYVDGELSVFSAFFDGSWHTVLTGGLGAGGKGRFALDITDPDLTAETESTGNDRKILWEQDGSNDPDIGDAFGQPVIARLNDGNSYVVTGNGYNSSNGIAMLILTNIADGSVTKISTGSGIAASPNGLSTPALIDRDDNGTVDVVFAGDIDGNLWKFDLTGTSGWNLAYKLYAAGSTQPITTAPEVTNHPNGGHLVLFGTGRIFTAADLADSSAQGLYGIWDTGSTPASANLLTQTLSADRTVSGETIRTISNGDIDWTTHTGWKIGLSGGLRLVTHPVLRATRLQTTITDPVTNSNYLIEPNYLNGGAPEFTIFDVNKDGSLTTADHVDGSSDPLKIPVAWKVSDGIMSQPVIARIDNAIDTKFLNFLSPPLAPVPCTENCTSGFVGGHIDVDTDAPATAGNGFAGDTTKHNHEFDKTVGQVYIDYFRLDEGSPDQIQIDDAIADPNKKFFIVMANADLSPNSKLHIGLNVYNAVEYQQMIQRKLKTWDGALNTLLDDDGNSLIVSINDILVGDGTLRNAFNDRAIIDGGLH